MVEIPNKMEITIGKNKYVNNITNRRIYENGDVFEHFSVLAISPYEEDQFDILILDSNMNVVGLTSETWDKSSKTLEVLKQFYNEINNKYAKKSTKTRKKGTTTEKTGKKTD